MAEIDQNGGAESRFILYQGTSEFLNTSPKCILIMVLHNYDVWEMDG